MFLEVNMSLILNNPTDFGESPIWNTLIPFRPKLPDDIDDSNDSENEKDDDEVEKKTKKKKKMMMIYHYSSAYRR
jgi:hypothetical protein